MEHSTPPTAPEMTILPPFVSNSIEAVGHDGRNLWIRYRRKNAPGTGALYCFENVPRVHMQDLMKHPRPGKYFTDVIRFRFPGLRLS